jgi:hypothetical protein
MTDPGAVAGVGASDDDAAQPVLPAAFLGVSIDAEPDENERGLEPGVAFLPSDLPRVDDARERLQEAIVVATRANQRAAASRRARAKRPKPAAPSGTVPRRIDEVDPYASAANR